MMEKIYIEKKKKKSCREKYTIKILTQKKLQGKNKHRKEENKR